MLHPSVPLQPMRRSIIALDLRYALFALAYVAVLYWLGSRAELGIARHDSLGRLLANLYHIPLYAGLAFFILQALTKGQGLAIDPWPRAALTFILTGALAALDELHQIALPSRDAAIGDLLLDLVGIAGMLLTCALGAREDPSQ